MSASAIKCVHLLSGYDMPLVGSKLTLKYYNLHDLHHDNLRVFSKFLQLFKF